MRHSAFWPGMSLSLALAVDIGFVFLKLLLLLFCSTYVAVVIDHMYNLIRTMDGPCTYKQIKHYFVLFCGSRNVQLPVLRSNHKIPLLFETSRFSISIHSRLN